MKPLPCTIAYHFVRQLQGERNKNATFHSCYSEYCGTDKKKKKRSGGIPQRWGWREMAKETPQAKVQEAEKILGWVWGTHTHKILHFKAYVKTQF